MQKKIAFNYPKQNSNKIDDKYVHKWVDEMPRFNSCEYIIGSALDKESCSKNDMLLFVYENLIYPEEAKEYGIEGMEVVQFVINEKGQIEDSKIVRDIGGDCGEAVLDMMHRMSNLEQPFISGKQNGEKVKVLYTLPVRFKMVG